MPFDDTANIHALRARLLSLPPVAQAAGSLAATSEGYTRTEGSFLEDGFYAGMEVVPSGFADTASSIVTSVTAKVLYTTGTRAVEGEAGERSLTSALPPLVAWENTDSAEFPPAADRWWVDENYVPGPKRTISLGALAEMEHKPLYVVKLYSPPGYDVPAPYKVADSIEGRFPPRLSMPLPDGSALRVRGDAAPYRGQLTVREGWALITVTIPLEQRSLNTI